MADPGIFKLLFDYGILGIFAVVLLIVARALLLREQKRADEEHAEVLRLNGLMQEKFLPALISATQAIAASQSLLQALQFKQQVEAEAARKAQDGK